MAKPLRVGEALLKARRILNEGAVILRPHLKDRMKERRFDMQDIIHCFETGRINKSPEWNKNFQCWEYVVDGKDLEGDNLSIVFAFEEDDLILITGKRKEK